MNRINVLEVEFLAFKLAQEHMTFHEPIPDFSTRRPNILESCLGAPFQTFGGRYLYPNFITRASMLFYLMIKNHPFENGNKRIAMTTLMTFLYMNNKWLNVDTQKLYIFTVWVAQSLPESKNAVIKAIEDFIKKFTAKREGK